MRKYESTISPLLIDIVSHMYLSGLFLWEGLQLLIFGARMTRAVSCVTAKQFFFSNKDFKNWHGILGYYRRWVKQHFSCLFKAYQSLINYNMTPRSSLKHD